MKLNEHVYFRKMHFAFVTLDGARIIAVYSALLKGEKNLLVDCGVSYNFPDNEQLCFEAGLKLSDISMVVNTHCHADHAGCNAILKQLYPELVFGAHPQAKVMLEDMDLHFKTRPVPYFNFLMGGNVPIERVFCDGDVFDDTGYPVKVIYSPGHSTDSISFFLPQDRILIAGDGLMNMEEMPFYEDAGDLCETFDKLEALNPRYIISGFNGLWDTESDGNLFAKCRERLETIQHAVEVALSADPDLSLRDAGAAALCALNINMPPSPLFLKGIESNIIRCAR